MVVSDFWANNINTTFISFAVSVTVCPTLALGATYPRPAHVLLLLLDQGGRRHHHHHHHGALSQRHTPTITYLCNTPPSVYTGAAKHTLLPVSPNTCVRLVLAVNPTPSRRCSKCYVTRRPCEDSPRPWASPAPTLENNFLRPRLV